MRGLPPPIRSSSHPLARQARALARGPRQRREEGLFLVEGPRGLAEALDAGAPLVWVLVADGRRERWSGLLARCLDAGVPVQPVRDTLLERVSPTPHGQGILAAARLPADHADVSSVLSRAGERPLVVLLGVQDPGNLGALVRSALAFGAGGLLAAGGADPWNEKAVRASAGAIHRLPVVRLPGPDPVPGLLEADGRRAVLAETRGGRDPVEVDWSGRLALLLGPETGEVPPAVREAAEAVTIPLAPGVESLSVPVAGSILLHVLARIRRGSGVSFP